MGPFEEKAKALASTAGKIAQLRGEQLKARILSEASATLVQTGSQDHFDEDSTLLFTLMLEVPVLTYAAVGEGREALEYQIRDDIAPLVRSVPGNAITEVVISPKLAEESRPVELSSKDGPPDEVPSFWQPGFFRLFISHLSGIKALAHALKQSLSSYHIAAFVAHDDIEPTSEWQSEIERALRTMDAMTAIIEPGFVTSRWCDQEIGFAFGRGKLVIPLCAGADPHGFLAKHQGAQIKGRKATLVAETLFDIIIQHPSSAERMTDVLVERLVNSPSWESSKLITRLLEKSLRLNHSQVARLVQSIDQNFHVGDAFGVPERVRRLVIRIGGPTPPLRP
jgi:hypothetical protein